MSEFIVQIVVPIMTPEKFAVETGLSARCTSRGASQNGDEPSPKRQSQIVQGMMKNGVLPTKKFGKHRMVNVAEVMAECLLDINKN